MTQAVRPRFGLDSRAQSLIVGILQRHPQVQAGRVFGSRALNTYRPESDVDLALYGDIDEELAARIAGELDELPLPYAFDVRAYACLQHVPLREHIDRVGVPLFSRDTEAAALGKRPDRSQL